MILEYLSENYITLIILLGLTIIILVNRRFAKISAARYFGVAIALLLLITVIDSIDVHFSALSFLYDRKYSIGQLQRLRQALSACTYILQPLIIMIEVLLTAPNRTFRIISVIPSVINTIVYSTAFFGSRLAFFFNNSNHFQRGPLGLTIYFVLLFYVFLLALFSIIYSKWNEARKSAILLLIVVQSILAAVLEYMNIVNHVSEPVIALCMLEYYFYLSVIYQQEIREMVAEKELYITKQKMDLLRGQIQPHFLFNSLSVIRALAKHDSRKAVQCIDSFSDYLKAHIRSLQEEDLIPFEQEMTNTQAYLDLVQADSTRQIDVVYDLQCTDFMIPQLSLEPIVENSIKHGIGRKGGTVFISSGETEDSVFVRISDNGSPDGGMTEQETKRLGVGLDNTRKRLKMQCNGTLDMNLTDEGAVVTVTIPKEITGIRIP